MTEFTIEYSRPNGDLFIRFVTLGRTHVFAKSDFIESIFFLLVLVDVVAWGVTIYTILRTSCIISNDVNFQLWRHIDILKFTSDYVIPKHIESFLHGWYGQLNFFSNFPLISALCNNVHYKSNSLVWRLNFLWFLDYLGKFILKSSFLFYDSRTEWVRYGCVENKEN